MVGVQVREAEEQVGAAAQTRTAQVLRHAAASEQVHADVGRGEETLPADANAREGKGKGKGGGGGCSCSCGLAVRSIRCLFLLLLSLLLSFRSARLVPVSVHVDARLLPVLAAG